MVFLNEFFILWNKNCLKINKKQRTKVKYFNKWIIAWLFYSDQFESLGTGKSEASTDFCDRRGQLYASWSFLLSKQWIKVLMVVLWICCCFVVHYDDSLMQLLTGTLQLLKKWQILSLPNACCLLTNACNCRAVEVFEQQSYELSLLPGCSCSI